MNNEENITLPDTQVRLANARVKLDKLPTAGRRLKVVATRDQLAAIARYSRVKSVEYLHADLLVSGFKGGVRVSGRVRAGVVQPCVVSLAPLSQSIDEELARVFVFGPDVNGNAAPGSENFVDLSGDDIPDYFEGNEVDLSPLVLEALGLAIELYPRTPGAIMSQGHGGDDPAQPSPFALLRPSGSTDRR